MKRIALASTVVLLAAAGPAPAPSPSQAPATIELPLGGPDGMAALRNYLGTRPYDEVSAYMQMLGVCGQTNLPPGQCVAVSGAQAAREAKQQADTATAVKAAVDRQKAEDAKALADAVAKQKAEDTPLQSKMPLPPKKP